MGIRRVIFLGGVLFAIGANDARCQGDDDVKVGGDFRYRHEVNSLEGKKTRIHHRIRGRIGLNADVNNDVTVTIQLAAGSDDPISSNQTLTGGFSKKGINLNLASFSWRPSKIEGLDIHGGKMKNPFMSPGKTELMWDSDLNPEGFSAAIRHDMFGIDAGLSGSYLWIVERKSVDDSFLLGGQADARFEGDAITVSAGMGYFDYRNARGYNAFFDSTDSAGNSLDPRGKYLYDYNLLEVFADTAFPVIPGKPSVFADYVTNTAGDVGDGTAWLVGVSAGKCTTPGTFAGRVTYRKVERDALIGAFTDSDFIDGGTDGKGFEVNIDCQVAKGVVAEASYFVNQAGIDKGKKFNRLQIDMNFKF